MQIEEVAKQKLDLMIIDGTVEKMIEKHLTKTLDGVLEDMFRLWSDFGKKLKEVINDKMNINLDQLNIDEYSAIVCKIIEKEVDNTIIAHATGQIQQHIKDVVNRLDKTEWKLSELVNKYAQHVGEWQEDEVALEVEEKYSSLWVSIGKKGKKGYSWSSASSNDYEMKLLLDLKTKKVQNAWWQGTATHPIADKLYGIQVFLMQLWMNQCTVVIDINENDIDMDEIRGYND